MNALSAQHLLGEIEGEYRRYERKQHPENFPPLPEFSAARYADPGFWELEQKYLWPRSWLIAGHVDEVPEKGSYKLWNESGVPVVIVRGKDNVIRAFYNVCQHRGGPLAYEPEGRVTALSCKYHAWTYDLEGKLVFVPDEHELPGLDKASRGLRQLRCELWGNFIFVNRDPAAPPLLDHLGPMVGEFKEFGMERRRVYAKVEYEMRCNWKTGIESNAEAYHVLAVHPETVHKMLDYRGNAIHLFRNGHSRILTPYNKVFGKEAFQLLDFDSEETAANTIAQVAIRNYVIFPNLMISAGGGDSPFPLITYWPDGIGNTRMVVYYTTTDPNETGDSPECQEVIKGFDIALDEDRAALAATQESYEKALIDSVRMAYVERRLYHLEEEIDRVVGIDRIPEGLRIKPVTANHVADPG